MRGRRDLALKSAAASKFVLALILSKHNKACFMPCVLAQRVLLVKLLLTHRLQMTMPSCI